MMQNHNLSNEDINHFIPHQTNYRIIKLWGEALGFNDDQTHSYCGYLW